MGALHGVDGHFDLCLPPTGSRCLAHRKIGKWPHLRSQGSQPRSWQQLSRIPALLLRQYQDARGTSNFEATTEIIDTAFSALSFGRHICFHLIDIITSTYFMAVQWRGLTQPDIYYIKQLVI